MLETFSYQYKRNRKWKLAKKWRDLWMKVHTNLIYFGDHRCLSRSEESKCMWIHGNDSAMWVFWKVYQVSVCLCVLSTWDLFNFQRVFPFFSYLLCYPYFVTFLSMRKTRKDEMIKNVGKGGGGERRWGKSVNPTWLTTVYITVMERTWWKDKI